MTHLASYHKRKLFCFLVFFIALSSFTADICDLREELQILSCLYNSLDNNITAGMTDQIVFDAAPTLTLSPVHGASTIAVASPHILPCGFRAPPIGS